MVNGTTDILNTLKTSDISDSVKETVLPILEQHIDRIQFVKNFAGLQDILYFEENDMYLYEFPLFISLDCKSALDEGESFIDLFADVYEKAKINPKDIIDSLWDFFENTDRTLYVEVGFKENLLDNDDILDVFNDMPNHRDREPYELMIEYYKYPDWYNVRSGKEIYAIKKSVQFIQSIERELVSNRIIELKTKIDELLIDEKFSEIKLVSEKIEFLEKQLN